jgi:hypothetical protein
VAILHVSCHVNSNHNDVAISTFYDARELQPGQDFQSRFEQEIHRGTLLAIVSDIERADRLCLVAARLYPRE